MEQQNMLTNNFEDDARIRTLIHGFSEFFAIDARYIKGAKGLVWKIDDWQPHCHSFDICVSKRAENRLSLGC